PIRHGGISEKKRATSPRLSLRLSTGRPDLSAPCTWKTCFAMSSPMVATIFMAFPPRGELTNSLLRGGSIPLGQEQSDRIDHPANKCCFIEAEVSNERNKPYPTFAERQTIYCIQGGGG